MNERKKKRKKNPIDEDNIVFEVRERQNIR